jgi:ABC-2 type transport system ATP-binding protein
MDDTIIKVENVSMMFNLSSEKVDSIKEYVIKMIKGTLMFEEFWALQDISFEIKKGERFGIVGLNGSGKSTLLKVISGVLKPTKGKVIVHGMIAPLIELGAGFDLDLSAKENIFLNGAILGYSRQEMQEKYDEIIEFSELRNFENVAIKNFSSGMVARLGFAIATCHIPDILIVDEILSVGDFEFQKKCQEKMKQMTESGTTVLFVSHSQGQIVELCDKAIWLQNGHLVEIGDAVHITQEYLHQS